MDINCLLFDDFETLDLFGPVEIFGKVSEFHLRYYSQYGGVVCSRQDTLIQTEKLPAELNGILLIPGGQGTRDLVHDKEFMEILRQAAEQAKWCLTVCTGSAMLAHTGVLNQRCAATNQKAFTWAQNIGRDVKWQKDARWVADGKYYTSEGVSAGIDMALAFVTAQFGEERAKLIAELIEYQWEQA
jgi:putative intracellular protease/amidase